MVTVRRLPRLTSPHRNVSYSCTILSVGRGLIETMILRRGVVTAAASVELNSTATSSIYILNSFGSKSIINHHRPQQKLHDCLSEAALANPHPSCASSSY